MSETYFDQVNEEFNRLGLDQPSVMELAPWPPDIWSHYELPRLINRTYVHQETLARITRNPPPENVETYPAQQMIVMLGHGQRPEATKYHVCCSSAEHKLVEGLDSELVADPHFTSPLILTKEDEPIGLIKGYGEDSLYGLVDVPEYGIVKGAFATPMNRSDMLRMARAEHAWQAPIELLGKVVPLRLSLFTLPLEERAKPGESIDGQDDRICFNTTHEDITSQTYQLLSDAQETRVLADN